MRQQESGRDQRGEDEHARRQQRAATPRLPPLAARPARSARLLRQAAEPHPDAAGLPSPYRRPVVDGHGHWGRWSLTGSER
ncbi:hypothetical protein [Actinomadura macra]|uniref:hypothetical protein n=1 Tax=Actinomadura macra TaxID=46164 RepID=UPI0012F8443C|nr:hypothetical protein [Actinomadura macra]